jgi:hypothetical protein
MLDRKDYFHIPTYPKTVGMTTHSSDAKVPMQPIKQLGFLIFLSHFFQDGRKT